MKTCARCHLLKPLAAFTRMAQMKDGYHYYCRDCKNSDPKLFAYRRSDKNLRAMAEYNAAHRAERSASTKRWAAANPRKNKNREIYAAHGITIEVYERMLAEQGGGCAICGATPDSPSNNGRKRLCVDHDHTCCPATSIRRSCGKCVRGLLCSGCNTGLGSLRDDPALLGAAISYLRRERVDRTDLIQPAVILSDAEVVAAMLVSVSIEQVVVENRVSRPRVSRLAREHGFTVRAAGNRSRSLFPPLTMASDEVAA